MKYELPRDGIDAQVQREQERADVIRDMRGSNSAESIVVTGTEGFTTESPSTSTRVRLANAALTFWHDVVNFPTQFGRLAMAAGERSFFLYPPYAEGHRHANSLIISGRDEGTPGNAQLASDGYVRLQVKDADGDPTGSLIGIAETISLDASGDLILDATRIMPYGLDTTGAGTPLVVDFPDGFPVLKLSSSALKFKQDVEDYDVDPEVALQIRTVLFRERAAVAERGDDAPQLVGVIADELHDLGLTHFVDYDQDGEVRGARYDRIWIALLSLAKHEHAKRLDLESKVADLTARLEALEAK